MVEVLLSCRTSTWTWAVCSCRRRTSRPRGSTWLRSTAGLWRSCIWRWTWRLRRERRWTPAASASEVSERPERDDDDECVRVWVCSVSAGLKLQGAVCANNKLSLSTSISTELPLTQLRWMKQSSAEKRNMVRHGPSFSLSHKNNKTIHLVRRGNPKGLFRAST